MPTDFEAMKAQLLESNDEFRQLATQHHDLDEKIHSLATRPYLSEPEQLDQKKSGHFKKKICSNFRKTRLSTSIEEVLLFVPRVTTGPI